jgi:ABC-type multidrug transport system ATPase subunit
MNISLHNIGKKFNGEWIFKRLSYTFHKGEHYAITGFNGSGKSTLLQTIAGYIIPTEGELKPLESEQLIDIENLHQYIGFASPYLELIEDFTALEMANFQAVFKPFKKGITSEMLVEQALLIEHNSKPIKNYSSGMKQRLKLALAILSDTPILLLDEPTSNLDKQIINWYKNIVSQHIENRLVIVCSNEQTDDYFFCKHFLKMEDYKNSV